ncbi:disulfide bond formation protein B, partial [Gilvimarinus sp. 1_MG-2023]
MSPRLLRFGYLAGFLICAALLGAAYYFEIVLYMEPCPLC